MSLIESVTEILEKANKDTAKKQSKAQEIMRQELKRLGVKSPAELTKDQRRELFNKIDKAVASKAEKSGKDVEPEDKETLKKLKEKYILDEAKKFKGELTVIKKGGTDAITKDGKKSYFKQGEGTVKGVDLIDDGKYIIIAKDGKKFLKKDVKVIKEAVNDVVMDAINLSNGTLATLTGEKNIKKLEKIQNKFVKFVDKNKNKYKKWNLAWQDFAKQENLKEAKNKKVCEEVEVSRDVEIETMPDNDDDRYWEVEVVNAQTGDIIVYVVQAPSKKVAGFRALGEAIRERDLYRDTYFGGQTLSVQSVKEISEDEFESVEDERMGVEDLG